MGKLRGCTPFPELLVTCYGHLGHPIAKPRVLPSPPNSITTAQGTKANACMTDPFGISVMVVSRNANESETFSGGYYANLYEECSLSSTAHKLLCICTFWLRTEPTTNCQRTTIQIWLAQRDRIGKAVSPEDGWKGNYLCNFIPGMCNK